jgi:hypothetical protein
VRWAVASFWAGAAILFAVGGALHLVRFSEMLLRARGQWSQLGLLQLAWLAAAIFLFVCGLTSVALCMLLAGSHGSGFYGSLLFGLLLTLLAPLSSLLVPQPDYFAAACAGLLPAGIVLLTLAVLPGLARD